MKSSLKSPVKSQVKTITSPRSTKSSLKTQTQTPLSKFKVIKQLEEQNPEIDHKQQIDKLKKYITELETMVSQHNIQYLYIKGIMEMEHKRGIELEAKNNLETKVWQSKMAVKDKEQEQRKREIELLKREIQSYRVQVKQLNYQKQILEGENRIKENQLEQYKYKMESVLIDKDKQIQYRQRKQIQRSQQQQSLRQLEKKAKQITKFSKQQFFIIGKMQQLSYLIQKQTSQQFIIQDTKRIQTLQNRIRLNSLQYQNQLIKLKNEIKKINECYKQEMVAKEKQIKAEMLCKYQSKVNLIPNLRREIKRLEERIGEKEREIEGMVTRELMYRKGQMERKKGVTENNKVIDSEFNEENSNQSENTEGENTK